MPDIFISYSSKDTQIATAFKDQFERQGLSVFLAGVSLREGERWTEQIFEALRASQWVFVLATPNALTSDAVKQEIGGAITAKKRPVPIMVGIKSEGLPTWWGEYQGIELENLEPETVASKLDAIADRIQTTKRNTFLVGAALMAALVMLSR